MLNIFHLYFKSPYRVLEHIVLNMFYIICMLGASTNNIFKCFVCQFSLLAQHYLSLCDPMDCRTPGFPVHHQLPELAQTHGR